MVDHRGGHQMLYSSTVLLKLWHRFIIYTDSPLSNSSGGLVLPLVLMGGSSLDGDKLSVPCLVENFSVLLIPPSLTGSSSSSPSPSSLSSVESSKAAAKEQAPRSLQLGGFPSDVSPAQ